MILWDPVQVKKSQWCVLCTNKEVDFPAPKDIYRIMVYKHAIIGLQMYSAVGACWFNTKGKLSDKACYKCLYIKVAT